VGSVRRVHQIGGVLVIVAAALYLNGIGNHGPRPLHADHTKTWAYQRVPHRPPTAFERRLADVASFVARRPVEVRCEDVSDGTPFEPGGMVEFHAGQPAEFARIRPDVCTRLLRFTQSPMGAAACVRAGACDLGTSRMAYALTALAHESIHLRGVPNEAVTQCYAMQEVPQVAQALGGSAEEGRALATVEYLASYPHMPANYRPPDCRPGGRLDLGGGTWLG
jgi:hypothetical protein